MRDGSARRWSPASSFNKAAQVQARQVLDTGDSELSVLGTWTTGQLHYRGHESNHMSTVLNRRVGIIHSHSSGFPYRFRNPFTRRRLKPVDGRRPASFCLFLPSHSAKKKCTAAKRTILYSGKHGFCTSNTYTCEDHEIEAHYRSKVAAHF